MNNHLFIVCSPLQLRVALAIKKNYDGDIFHIIYLQTKSGLKEYVRKSLKCDFNTYHIADMDYAFFNIYRIVSYLKENVGDEGYAYIANANDLTVQYILSQIPSTMKLRTFDDGILNINTISDINHKIKEKKKLRYLLTRLCYKNTMSIRKIIENSSLHFTILDKNRTLNVKTDIVKLNILECNEILIDNDKSADVEIVNVFVGSKFKDILANKGEQQLDALIHKIRQLHQSFDNILYLRHPREMSSEVFSMNEVNVDSISEDYIYDLVRKGVVVNVIGFASTCQLNTMNLPNVRIILLKTNLIRNDILDSFSLFNKKEVVSIYDLDA